MKNKYILAVASFFFAQAAMALSPDVEAQYPAPWISEFNFEITKAMTQAKVKQCGIIKYRVSRNSNSEFLVACSSDGTTWSSYMVWPKINKVMGPYTMD